MRLVIATIVNLAGICVAAAFNWHLAMTTPDISPIENNRKIRFGDDGEQSKVFEARGIKLFQASVRPLFSPERRPWIAPVFEAIPDPALLNLDVSPPEQLDAAELTPLEARLIGVQKTPDGAMALLVDSSGALPSWVKVGAIYKDWKVEDITAFSVRLINGQSTLTFDLYPELATGTGTP